MSFSIAVINTEIHCFLFEEITSFFQEINTLQRENCLISVPHVYLWGIQV